ncbi:MAG: hypothetical protein L3K04_01635 [Thermoplasmata archaeon]|nr:hypothetical protein [Thermoplasmata archaeon]MCI4341862.1 hypothetical protein [Thermoplasmata archaeon]
MLLLGPQGKGTLRTLGRWYGRAMNLKNELLGELSANAGIPLPTGGAGFRGFLLTATDPAPMAHAGAVPVAVSAAPAATLTSVAVRLEPVATACAVSALGPGSWSWASSASATGVRSTESAGPSP